MTSKLRFAAIGAALFVVAPVDGVRAADAVGLASWYQLPGRTACGGRHNPEAMTAAHRTLPCGSTIKVTNLSNGRSAVVTIVDRGPFVRGRIVDISRGAARKIGLIDRGVGRVSIVRH
jgi:rare lipoprotein A